MKHILQQFVRSLEIPVLKIHSITAPLKSISTHCLKRQQSVISTR
jgi:hypothetical protein